VARFVKLCDICESSLLGQDCISQSSIVYDQFHIQAVCEQMMDLWNVNVCMYSWMYVNIYTIQ